MLEDFLAHGFLRAKPFMFARADMRVRKKLYVAERYASKEYLSETKREILDSIRDLARRIEHP
jgi:hypothetical protein